MPDDERASSGTSSYFARANGKKSAEISAAAPHAGRKHDLLQAATRLFGSRGFHGASMGEIAAATGIHKASVYHWVESKEDLLYQVLSGALDSLIENARLISADDKADFATKLRRLVSLHAQYTVNHPDVMQVFLAEAKWLGGARGREVRDVRRQYHRLYEDLFWKALERGEISAPSKFIPVYVNLLFSMTNHLSVWFKHKGPASIIEVADLISDLVLGNIAPLRD
jgi:AcrR family transcriptional regulator